MANTNQNAQPMNRPWLDKVLILALLIPLLSALYAYTDVGFLHFNRVGYHRDVCWAETVVHPVLLWHPFPRKTLIAGSGTHALVKEALRHFAASSIHWTATNAPDLSVDDDILNRTVYHRNRSTHDLLVSSDLFDIIILDQIESLPTVQLAAERLSAGGILALALPESWEQTFTQALPLFKHVHLFKPFDSMGRSSYYAVATNSDALPLPTHLSVAHVNALIGRRITHKSSLKYYDGEIHLQMFLLQRHIREMLRNLHNKTNTPESSLPDLSPFPFDKMISVPLYPTVVTETRDFVQCTNLPSSKQDAINLVLQSLKNGEAISSRGLAFYSWATYQNVTTSPAPPDLDATAMMLGPELDTSKPVGNSAPAHLTVTAIYDGGSVSLHILPHLGYARASITNFNSWVAPDEVLNRLGDIVNVTRSSGSLATGPPPIVHSNKLDERLSHLGDGEIGSLHHWRPNYPDWSSPKIGIRRSSIAGTGIWAKEDISKGEVIFRSVIEIDLAHIEEFKKFPLWRKQYLEDYGEQTDDDVYAVSMRKDDYISYYLNHACSPNTKYNDTFDYMVAMRNISAGEELTFDYSTTSLYVDFDCQCGSNACRHVVSGTDWQNEELVARLGEDAFWPSLKAKILKRKRGGR